MENKYNLWSFNEYEKFFIEEEDIVKICVLSSVLFENWPFKHLKNKNWTKIIKKILKRIDCLHEEYFKDGFQHKTFSPEDKIVLNILFGLVQRIYGFSEEPPSVKIQDKILRFAICFDPDVVLMTFNTIFMIGEPISISRTLPAHYEIFYKFSEFENVLNDTFPQVKDKIYRPVSNLIIKESPIATFWELSGTCRASDRYITILRKMMENNNHFNTIIRQNSIMIVFSTLNSNEYYHRLSSVYDILDLERDRNYIKNLDVDNLIKNSRKKFVNIIEKEGLMVKFNDIFSMLSPDHKQSCLIDVDSQSCLIDVDSQSCLRNIDSQSYIRDIGKCLSYIRDIDLELKWNFERYLIFCAGYDLNIVHLIYILELGEANGIFYQSLENALNNPEYDKLIILTLLESLIRIENQTVINCNIILNYVSRYLEGKNDDVLQCFLKDLWIFIKENEECASALLKENYVEKFCEYLEDKDINENNDIFIILIDILFYLYKKQNTKLEPFEESRFSRICFDLINLKNESNERVSIRCFNIFTYFINADPLSIETLGKIGIDKLLENVKVSTSNEQLGNSTSNEQLGICLINFIDALSLNIQYAKKLRDESLFSSILARLNIYDIKMPLLPDGSLIDAISVFLRHHPEYNEEYSLYCIDRFEKMTESYKSKTLLETEMKVVENFLESFSHLKSNTVLDKDNYKERMVVLVVELYSQVSIYDNQPVSSVFTVYQMFVSILGFLDNEKSAVKFVIPKLGNVVNEMKGMLNPSFNDNDLIVKDEYKLLMLKGEKLVSLISGIINNFISEKSMSRSLLESVMKYSLELFILTIDYIDGMYDHGVMGGSFVSSYLDLGSKFNKEQKDTSDNFKLSSILICFNNVFLLKYAIEEYDTVSPTNSETFFEKYLDLISGCFKIDKSIDENKPKRIKRSFETEQIKRNFDEDQVEKILVLCKVLQHLSEYFDKKLFQIFCVWIKKHELFKNCDSKIREIILEILSNCFSLNIENEYKKIIIEFLGTFDSNNGDISQKILTTVTNFYGLEKKVDCALEPVLSSLVSKHYFPGCTHKFRFLMENLDFIIQNIRDENYNIFVDSITEDTLAYFALLINFHYEIAMFDLLKCMLEVLTFVKKEVEKDKLVEFMQKLKENCLFEIHYSLDDVNMKKLVDKDGFIQIDPSIVLKQLNSEITKSYTVVTPMNWSFFLVCEKYCEVRAGKFGILTDTNLLFCCLYANCHEICLFPMLIIHSIFSNLRDIYELKTKILDKKDVLTFYGLDNDNYDYFPLVYRNPNIIFMKEAPKVPKNFVINRNNSNDNDVDTCFSILMAEALRNENFLFILSEISFNYPRYIQKIDLSYIKKMNDTYLGDDLNYIKDSNKQVGARRVLELFSICVHSRVSLFLKNFIKFIRILLKGTSNDICNAIVILCNVSNPLNTLTSGLEHGVKDKNIFLAFSEFLKNGILNLFVSVLSRINVNELPNLKELSNNSETLISNLGIKNSNFFMIQNHLFGFDSYDMSEFNPNTMSNSHDDILNIGLNFIYNIFYTVFQKEIEDSGICDIEISDDDLEDEFDSNETFYEENDNESSSTTIYNETEPEEVFEDVENVIMEEESKTSEESTVDTIPMVRSTYLRYETAFKSIEEDNMKLIFESISKLASKADDEILKETEIVLQSEIQSELESNENGETVNEENEDSEESSVGVYDGFIPSKTTEEVNEMDEVELNDYITGLMDERKATSLDYKPLDKNYLDGLIKPYRVIFESHELHLKDFYYPEIEVFSEKNEENEIVEVDLRLSRDTILDLIDAFYSGKFGGKPQVYNIFKIMSLSSYAREVLLSESISRLKNEIGNLHINSYDNSYENIRKSMEIIRIMTLKFKLENIDQKHNLVRSLFKLLRHKGVSIKALHLLNKIEFENEIFNSNNNEIVIDILKLSEGWISKKTNTYLKNVIRKVSKGTINILPPSIIHSITNEFVNILNCDDSLKKYMDSQSRILNLILIFDICFSSFFEFFRNEYKDNIELFFTNIGIEYKNIENIDFKYLYNLYKHSQGVFIELDYNSSLVPKDILTKDILDSLNYLIKNCIEKVIRKLSKDKSSIIDYYYMSGLYNVYFLIFSVYEGLINHYCVFILKNNDTNDTNDINDTNDTNNDTNDINNDNNLNDTNNNMNNLNINDTNDTNNNMNNLNINEHCIDTTLEQYDTLRNELGLFLNSNILEINTIFSVEKDVFSQNIRFLSRFNVINFVNKHNYFRGKIQDLNLYKEGNYTINVRRKDVLSDSLFQIMNKTSIEFKAKRLQVKFSGEEGLDFGGITREWIDLLVKDLTMPDKGLFAYTSDKKTTFLPYRNSKVNPDHLLYFRFVGRILAKSILDRITLDFHIDKSVYKYFLGKKCELSDLEAIDPQFYNSLIWMRDNPIEDVIVLTFSFEYLEFGDMKIVDLKPNGRNVLVTDENKQEYIDLIVEYKLFKGIEMQLNSIKTGLFEIIDRDLLSIFNENEFELLINGIPDINVDDWMNNTEYHGYKSNSTNIIWFWKAVRSFSPEERAKLLQFSTGSSRVPFEGFSHLQGNNGPQKFSIHKSNSDNVRLPSAHTCFNQLDLPEYPSFSDLRKSLIYAINECSEGFGLI